MFLASTRTSVLGSLRIICVQKRLYHVRFYPPYDSMWWLVTHNRSAFKVSMLYLKILRDWKLLQEKMNGILWNLTVAQVLSVNRVTLGSNRILLGVRTRQWLIGSTESVSCQTRSIRVGQIWKNQLSVKSKGTQIKWITCQSRQVLQRWFKVQWVGEL